MNLSNTQGSWQSELYASKMPTCGILLSTNMTGYRQLYGANFTLSETANRYTRYFSSHSQEEENTSRGGQPQTADNATQASTNSSKVPSNSATYALFIKGIPFLLLITIVLFLYLICLKMNLIDCFWTLLKKMGFSLGSRVLSKCWGWEGGLLLVVGILSTFGIMDRAIMKMTSGEDTVNPGPHRGDAGPSESSSSWRKYLNFSSDKEEKAESEASTALVPQPSTSSSWSGSWIEKWFSPEGSSAAPNQGQQPQGAPEASTGTSSRAHQPAGPSQSEAGGPIRVSPSSPSSPSPSWFERAEIYFQKRLGDQGEVSSAAQNERQQGEGALFQPTPPVDLPQPPLVGEQPGPSYSEQNHSAGDFDFNSEELRSLARHCLESSPEPGEEANYLTPQGGSGGAAAGASTD